MHLFMQMFMLSLPQRRLPSFSLSRNCVPPHEIPSIFILERGPFSTTPSHGEFGDVEGRLADAAGGVRLLVEACAEIKQ